MTLGKVFPPRFGSRQWFTAAGLALCVAGCRNGSATPAPAASQRKPTAVEAVAAAHVPVLPRSPVVPARRTGVTITPPPPRPPEDGALIAVGKKIFFDERLSEPPGTSCASCHDPKQAFSGTHGSDKGVPLGSRPRHFARRTAPSLLYLRFVPKFHFFEDDEAAAPSPFGGFFWDGRSDDLASLPRQPLFNPDEMNAGSPQKLATKIESSDYAADFERATHAGKSAEEVLKGVGAALEAFLTSDEMTPATSKYDAYVRGEATLTPEEQRGLEAFKDRARGACAGCHSFNETSTYPGRSPFSDYGFDAVGVPRNRELPLNRDPTAYDLGLCERRDMHTDDGKWCGSFRTPSLRNVAVRRTFMHNARFTKLRDVVVFYATRASAPENFYEAGDTFDDLPVKYRENVNIYSMPYNRPLGAAPAMSEQDIDAVVAFLGTLTDAAYLDQARARP